MGLSADIKGADRLRHVAMLIREAADTTLRRELVAALKAAAEPTVSDLKSAARSVPISGDAYPGRKSRYNGPSVPKNLRTNIANTIAAKVNATSDGGAVRLRASASKMPPAQRKLITYVDGKGRWRHPVMGNRRVWVSQHGKEWWWPTARKNLETFRKELFSAIDKVADKIEKG
jgi:hypothetical protein